jgi:hypothetical protein
MTIEFGVDPVRAGIDAAIRKLDAAGVPWAREYEDDPGVIDTVAKALNQRPLTQGQAAQALEREQVAELVGLGALIRASASERGLSGDLIERIRKLIKEIINSLGSP